MTNSPQRGWVAAAWLTLAVGLAAPAAVATAQSTDATVNVTMPISNTRLRPSRSARRPDATRNAAKTML